MPDNLLRVKAVMKCGHISSGLYPAEDGSRSPVCIPCYQNDETKMASRIVEDISKRKALCTLCGTIEKSDANLRNFTYHPNLEYDRFYNGCKDNG